MQEALLQLFAYARMVWRRRWFALIIMVLFCLTGWTVVITMPDSFEVKTKVYLDTQSMLTPLLKGLAVDTQMREHSTDMMRRTLLTRPNLETVARKTDLDLTAKTPEEMETLLEDLGRALKVSASGSGNIYTIAYQNSDAKLAKRVVESLLNIFVEKSLGASRKDTSITKHFLEGQIKEYEARLEEDEQRLKAFKRKNVGVMPEEGGSYFGQLRDLKKQVADSKLQQQEAERARDEYQRQLQGVSKLLTPSSNRSKTDVAVDPLDVRIQQTEESLDQLLLRFTEQHPDVVSTQRMLEDLRERREQRDKDTPAQEVQEKRSIQNPVYQELKVALGRAEAGVSALQARTAEYLSRMDELKKLIDTMPKVEAELAKLTRNYHITKENYEGLVRRRESAKIAREAEQSSDDIQFNVIEPPRVPLLPVKPNRPVLTTLVLIAGIGGGFGLAFLMTQIQPAYYSAQAIKDATNYPVLGNVSRIWSPKQVSKRRMEFAVYGTFVAGLFALYGGIVALQVLHIDILDKALAVGKRFL